MSCEDKYRPRLDETDLDALKRLRRHTDAARIRIHQEIAAYPAPIPACDAQFNFLLEKRRKLSEQLANINARITQIRSKHANFKRKGSPSSVDYSD